MMTHADSNAPHLATADSALLAAANASQRLEHSRERMRRYMLRAAAGDPHRQRAARSKRQVWVGVALAVALVLAWQQPWRRASGLARAVAFVIAGLKVPGLLSTLASRMEVLMAWWHTFTRTPSAPSDEGAPSQGSYSAQATQANEASAWDGLRPPGQATPAANAQTSTPPQPQSERASSPAH